MNREQYLNELLEQAKSADKVSGREAVVVENLGSYLQHRPNHDYAWFMYGDALRVLGRFEEAERALLKALELAPDSKKYTIQARLGMLQDDRANHKEAERWFALATADNTGGELGWLWIFRGANLAQAGDFGAAEKCHRKATTLEDGNTSEAYLNLGYVLRAQRRYSDAIAAFEQALKLDPNYAEAQEALAGLSDISRVMEQAAKIPEE